ncbi:GABBR2 [Symbiodinium sp. CCMP2456]|nr:GABBR2 [Symbiodinium sp. CCMP2456]
MYFPWLRFIALLPSAVSICPEVCTAAGGTSWPCRYYNGGQCTVDVNPSATRAAAQDINIAVISPYTGFIGDLMTMAEPLLALAAQEIEDSNYLPGYRVNLHLTDSACDEAQSTEAIIEAFTVGPTKHAILGDICSQCCAAVNDAARLFKVLMVSPGCDSPDLSDRARYPYFTRMTPSDRFKVTAIYEVFKMFGWRRVGVLDGLFYTAGAKAFFLELIQRDLDAGTYDWTVLLDRTVNTLADAESAADEVKVRDSRINMMVLPEFIGMWMMCQYYLRDMLPPDCWACTESIKSNSCRSFLLAYLVGRLIRSMPPSPFLFLTSGSAVSLSSSNPEHRSEPFQPKLVPKGPTYLYSRM